MTSDPKAYYYQDVIKNAVFAPGNPQPQTVFAEEPLKVITTGLDIGQKIPVHPEGLVVYIFLQGSGWMIVDDERMQVGAGATIITLSGAHRGIEANTRLVFLAVRISNYPSQPAVLP